MVLDHLTDEFKSISEALSPPDGRAGCDDCRKLDLLLAIDQDLRVRDKADLRHYQDRDHIRKEIFNRILDRENYLRDLLKEFQEDGDDFFADDGMFADLVLDSDPE